MAVYYEVKNKLEVRRENKLRKIKKKKQTHKTNLVGIFVPKTSSILITFPIKLSHKKI